ncbi:MAG TPA: TerB family tellurite resistance protein [Nevskiaceae bacterium]|nr:TerB family tellurite resistance protein [Nevskiaceae bacterium]
MKFGLGKWFGVQPPSTQPHDEALAVAQLLLEIARADLATEPAELAAIRAHLQQAYALSDAQLDPLMAHAQRQVEQSVSMADSLKQVNAALDPPRKAQLMRALWQVAYADGRIDPHEEAMLRRLADLLYVPHSVFIREKLGVAEGPRHG